MRRRKEPPNAIAALHRWRNRQRDERAAAAARQKDAAARAEASRKSALRRERAAERQAEEHALAVERAIAELDREERYFRERKDEAESRRIFAAKSLVTATVALSTVLGPSFAIYYLSHHPIPRSDALFVALLIMAVLAVALIPVSGWFLFFLQPWLERKRDAADAAKTLDRIATQRQSLDDGAFSIVKSRRPFGGLFEVSFHDQKAR